MKNYFYNFIILLFNIILIFSCGDINLVSNETTPDNPKNIIINGDFSNSFTNWITNSGSDGSIAVFDNSDDNAVISITNAGNSVNDISLDQHNLYLKKNADYTLSFDAKADSARAIVIGISKYSPNTDYYVQSVILSGTLTTFTYKFTIPEDCDNTVLRFCLGNNGTETVYIDNVSIK